MFKHLTVALLCFATVTLLCFATVLTGCQLIPQHSQSAPSTTTQSNQTAQLKQQITQKNKSDGITCAQDGDTLLAPKRLRGGFYRPLVVGHHLYRLATKLGADYIEPDLVMSKDGVLIVRKDNDLSLTTNASAIYPNLVRTKVIDGIKKTGVFSEDLTLEQIAKLKTNKQYAEQYKVLTFKDYLQMAKQDRRNWHRPIGLIPEIEYSTYYHTLGFDPEQTLVSLLNRYRFNRYDAPVIIQSMEVSNLKRLRKLVRVELMQVLGAPDQRPPDVAAQGGTLTYHEMATPKGLRAIARYADWVSLQSNWMSPKKADMAADMVSFIHDAHVAGLEVIPWALHAHDEAVLNRFFALGVDGLFTDFPDLAIKFRTRYLAKCNDVESGGSAQQ